MGTFIKIICTLLLGNAFQKDIPQYGKVGANYAFYRFTNYIGHHSPLHTHTDLIEEKEQPRIKKDGDFKDLVIGSTVFADKSLLIKTVIEDSSTGLLITMPRRWGKTVNLNMLKRFLEMPTANSHGEIVARNRTENYQLFSQACVLRPDNSKATLRIAQSKIRVKDTLGETRYVDALALQGTYPVIYLDFKDCKAANFDDIKEFVREELKECFNQYAYLQNSPHLDSLQHKRIAQYLEGGNDTRVERGLKALSKALHDHHGKKVWILIDEYDAALNEAYQNPSFSEKDLKDTIALFRQLYEAALKGNPSLEKAVVTGIQFMAKASAGSGLNNLEKIDITNAKYAPYYGLSLEEFEWFCDHFGVSEQHRVGAKAWYDGYTVPVYDAVHGRVTEALTSKYNVWSIVSYLKDGDFKHFKSYWEDSGSIAFLQELLKSPLIKRRIEPLLDEEDGGLRAISFSRESSFSDEDFSTLRNMMGGNKKVEEAGVNLILSYLFTLGYLTIDGLRPNAYRLPNMEIKYEMGKRLLNYYQTLYTIHPDQMGGLINCMQDMLSVNQSDPNNRMQSLLQGFYDQFQGVIQSLQPVGKNDELGIQMNEDLVHSLLNYIALQTQHTTFGTEVYTSKLNSNSRGRIDLKVTKGDIGIIIEVKCVPIPKRDNGHMKAAIKQAKSYGNSLKTNNTIFMAINVEQKENWSVERKIELLCDYNISTHRNVIGINASKEPDTFGWGQQS